MSIKKTTEEFIREAKVIHGGYYDYSMVEYKRNSTKVKIICPIHGLFEQLPIHHLNGHGCPRCRDERAKRKVYGVGINDSQAPIKLNGKHVDSYSFWRRMLERCYSKKWHEKHPTYIECFVCEEWKRFSCFNTWFNEHYIEGYELDKDILVQGNKLYSPSTCCFVPHRINALLCNCAAARGKYRVGVYWKSKVQKFVAQMQQDGRQKTLGYFDSEEDAHEAYKIAKYKEIRRVADEHYATNSITSDIRDALLRYRISEY